MWQISAMALAVTVLSPVTIRTFTPADWHLPTASGTSGRTGSMMPTIPIRVRSSSTTGQRPVPRLASDGYSIISSCISRTSGPNSRYARAMQRRAFFAMALMTPWTICAFLPLPSTRPSDMRVKSPVRGTRFWWASMMCVQSRNTISAAPLTWRMYRLPSGLCTSVDIRFRLELNGYFCTTLPRSSALLRVSEITSSCLLCPMAQYSSAPSVLFPLTFVMGFPVAGSITTSSVVASSRGTISAVELRMEFWTQSMSILLPRALAVFW
mmetsp:Transcript_19779/g.74782  ORF Transcript_19779/g.74782 Transcript_19779/m.74782 type:complete len:267 (-) Transcript_19779:1608-2408(-)